MEPLLRINHNAQTREGRNTLEQLAPTHAVWGGQVTPAKGHNLAFS
jgi:hypothetical protein